MSRTGDDIEPEDLRPGDLVKIKGSESEWRVVEPPEQRETAMHSGTLVGLSIKGSPSLGGWKPVRQVVEHRRRGTQFQTPDAGDQITLPAAANEGSR